MSQQLFQQTPIFASILISGVWGNRTPKSDGRKAPRSP
jgi:hypothetical protein